MTPTLKLAQAGTPPQPETRGRASVALNVVEGSTMIDEYRETMAEVEALVARIHILNTQAADMRLHLLLAGKL